MKNKNSEAHEPEFNMEDFGFVEFSMQRAGKSNEDYLIYSPKSDKTDEKLTLSLCRDSYDFVTGLIGDRVNVGMNGNGVFCVGRGRKNKVTKCSSNSGSYRGNISITRALPTVFEKHGKFRRLYLKTEPYAKFEALKLTPTGERDEL